MALSPLHWLMARALPARQAGQQHQQGLRPQFIAVGVSLVLK